MDYPAALGFLYSFANFERTGPLPRRTDLRPMLALLSELGDPHLGRPTVHVAGTKGKGSVAAMLESITRAAGLRTGLNTSPHLHRFTERIQLSGLEVAADEFARTTARVERAARKVQAHLPAERALLTFDLLTALAFLVFREHAVDLQIIEVGLGGRLDSTNVFEQKLCSVITRLGLEHQEILGHTLPEIAREKAGILRAGSPTVVAPQSNDAAQVIRSVAQRLGTPLIDVSQAVSVERLAFGADGQTCALGIDGAALTCRLPLLGRHQLDNAATARAAVEVLRRAGLQLSDEAIQRGFTELRWPARIELLGRRPWLLVDSAHTRDSAEQLSDALLEYLGIQSATFVVGVMRDKDLAAFARALAPRARRVIATRAEHPRASSPEVVAEAFAREGVVVQTQPSLASALPHALASEPSEGAVVVAGSVVLAGEARAALLGLPVDPTPRQAH